MWADLCTMTGDRRLLQIDKEKMIRSGCPVPLFEDGSETGCEDMDVFKCSGWRVRFSLRIRTGGTETSWPFLS